MEGARARSLQGQLVTQFEPQFYVASSNPRPSPTVEKLNSSLRSPPIDRIPAGNQTGHMFRDPGSVVLQLATVYHFPLCHVAHPCRCPPRGADAPRAGPRIGFGRRVTVLGVRVGLDCSLYDPALSNY